MGGEVVIIFEHGMPGALALLQTSTVIVWDALVPLVMSSSRGGRDGGGAPSASVDAMLEEEQYGIAGQAFCDTARRKAVMVDKSVKP